MEAAAEIRGLGSRAPAPLRWQAAAVFLACQRRLLAPACTASRPAHTAPLPQEGEYQVTGNVQDIFPDFVKMADAFKVPAKRVTHPSELR